MWTAELTTSTSRDLIKTLIPSLAATREPLGPIPRVCAQEPPPQSDGPRIAMRCNLIARARPYVAANFQLKNNGVRTFAFQ